MKKHLRMFALTLAFVIAMAVPMSAHALTITIDDEATIDGFTVPYEIKLKNNKQGSAELSCSGTKIGNPKPFTIMAYLDLSVIGSDNKTYICLRKAVEADYGTSISLSSSKSTPNNVSAIGTTGTYSFLGTTWSVSIGPNAG